MLQSYAMSKVRSVQLGKIQSNAFDKLMRNHMKPVLRLPKLEDKMMTRSTDLMKIYSHRLAQPLGR